MLISLLIDDAKHVLRRMPEADRVTLTSALMKIVADWQQSNGGNTVEAVCAAFDVQHGPLIDLTIEVAAIDKGKPLPRLMAMLILDAAGRSDWLTASFAHRYVAESVANSKRKAGKVGGDALTKIVVGYLASHPDATNEDAFEHVQALAEAGHMAFEEAEVPGTIEYRPRMDSIDCVVIDRAAFSKRMYKVRASL